MRSSIGAVEHENAWYCDDDMIQVYHNTNVFSRRYNNDQGQQRGRPGRAWTHLLAPRAWPPQELSVRHTSGVQLALKLLASA